MTIRMATVVTAAAVLLASTACSASPEVAPAPVTDLESWASGTLPAPTGNGFSVTGTTSPDGGSSKSAISDVAPGWYAVTLACAPRGSGSGPARMTLSGETGTYGTGECSSSPVTTTIQLGASAEGPPETITVAGESDNGEFFWGASASPTDTPQ